MGAPAPVSTAPPAPYQCPFPLTGRVVEHSGMAYTLMSKQDQFTFRELADGIDDWHLRYDKDGCFVWDRKVPNESIRMVKMFGTLDDCPPELLYDVLQDPEYRGVWDEAKLEGYRIALLDQANEIGYYAARIPGPVSNRSFLNQRCWIAITGREYVIFNTSVPHAQVPLSDEKHVRAWSKVSGYLVRPWGPTGSSLTYVTLSDSGGWIPTSVINYLTTKLAPTTLVNLRRATKGYAEWLATKPADRAKPWLRVEPVPWGVPTPVLNKTHDWIIERAGGAAPGSPTPATPWSASDKPPAEAQ